MIACFTSGCEVTEASACAQVLDAAYLKKYYKTRGAQGYSMQDLQLESMADPETVPFESRSIDMRVLTGQTSLFYTVLHQALFGYPSRQSVRLVNNRPRSPPK